MKEWEDMKVDEIVKEHEKDVEQIMTIAVRLHSRLQYLKERSDYFKRMMKEE